MLIAPLLLLAGEILHPQRSGDPLVQVGIVSHHMGAWYLSHLLLWMGVVLMLPAILLLTATARRAAPRPALVGGALAGLGAVCFACLLTVGFVVWQMGSGGADAAQMARLFERVFHHPGFVIPFQVLPLAFAGGMAILAMGLRRAGVAERPVAVAIIAGAFGVALIGIIPTRGYAVTAAIVFAAGLLAVGRTLLVASPAGASSGALRAGRAEVR